MNLLDRDTMILGAGPAGLQLAYYMQKAGYSYAVLERGDSPGTFFKMNPRHRKLISVNKVYTGHCDNEINYRWDWNALLSDDDRFMFRNYSSKYFPHADEMVRYLQDFAREQELTVVTEADIQQVTRNDEGFELVDGSGRTFRCRRLVVATGVSKAYIPPIPGIELAEQYADVSIDPQDFVNQRVLIIGKGNSGFETADALIDTTAAIHIASPHPVRFAWQSHFVGHLRALNNNLLDTYLLKCQNATLEADIVEIRKCDSRYQVTVSFKRAEGSGTTLEYDRVICCTGFRFDASIFHDSCRPELVINDRFPKIDSAWQSTTVPGLYFAGALMQSRDFKKTTSAFIHGFRYNVRAMTQILGERYYGEPIQHRLCQLEADAITQAVLDRVNRSSALWQQFGFLGDCIVPDAEQQQARYYEALPLEYVHDHPLPNGDEYYTVTLEYGFEEGDDPFSSKRVSHTDVENAAHSTFLHPVVRHFRGGQCVDECHIVENLEAVWRDEKLHAAPLREYFSSTLPSAMLS